MEIITAIESDQLSYRVVFTKGCEVTVRTPPELHTLENIKELLIKAHDNTSNYEKTPHAR